MKLLSELARSAGLPAPEKDIPVTGISMDSRTITSGELFCALHEAHIFQAISRGAAAVLTSQDSGLSHAAVPLLPSDDLRRSISSVCSAFYDHPSHRLITYGVTGTNGKTSTAAYLYQLLKFCSHKSFLISGGRTGSSLSTPEAPQLHQLLNRCLLEGATHGAVEITSHALSNRNCRTADLRLSGVIFTSMGRDHLDFHPTLEDYYRVKCSILNLAAKHAPVILSTTSPLLPLLKNHETDLRLLGRDICINRSNDTMFELTGPGGLKTVKLPRSPGYLQENMLLAVTAVWDELPVYSDLSEVLFTPPGRGEVLKLRDERQVIIDYAHNPEAIERVMMEYRDEGRLIVLSGAAGNRDQGKRPIMGEKLDSWSDLLFLTEEDPFGEDPMQIIRDILEGVSRKVPGKTLFIHPRRETAIGHALSSMEPGDTLLLLGKGHERTIRYGTTSRWWDEKEVLLHLARILDLGIG